MSDIDAILDDAAFDAAATSPKQMAFDKESRMVDLFAAAARMTNDLAEQFWLVAMCIHAGRGATYLDGMLAKQKARGRVVDRHPEGEEWVDGPGPLGISDMSLAW